MARLNRLQAALSGTDLDALLVTAPADLRLLTGFSGSAGTLLVTRSDARLLVDPRYTRRAASETGLPVTEYPKREEWTGALAALCEGRRSVGAQARHLLAAEWQELALALNGELTPADDLLAPLRELKTRDEVADLKAAGDLTWRAIDKALEGLEAGTTERELAAAVARGLLAEGDGLAFPVIAALGAATADPHAAPTDRRLVPGDLVLVDAGAKVRGWCGDVTVTTVFGAPDPRQADYLTLTERALAAAEAAAVPGASGGDVDEAARAVYREAGLEHLTLKGVGHGLGLEVHEAPRLVEGGEAKLQNGHVFTLEPGLYVEGWGGIRMERMYALADDALVPLSPWPRP